MSATPRITLKLATSLDGRIALAGGASQWITGSEARAAVHDLRAAHGAVLTGVGSILADDPLMTARPGNGAAAQPLRVVLDTRLRTPSGARLFSESPDSVVIVCAADVPARARTALERLGAQVIPLNRFDGPHVSFSAALDRLSGLGVSRVMIEAGARVAASAVKSGRVTHIEWFRAPVLLGGDSWPVISALGLETLDGAPRFRRTGVREAGEDLHESYERA